MSAPILPPSSTTLTFPTSRSSVFSGITAGNVTSGGSVRPGTIIGRPGAVATVVSREPSATSGTYSVSTTFTTVDPPEIGTTSGFTNVGNPVIRVRPGAVSGVVSCSKNKDDCSILPVVPVLGTSGGAIEFISHGTRPCPICRPAMTVAGGPAGGVTVGTPDSKGHVTILFNPSLSSGHAGGINANTAAGAAVLPVLSTAVVASIHSPGPL